MSSNFKLYLNVNQIYFPEKNESKFLKELYTKKKNNL